MLPDSAMVEPATSWSLVRHASDWATEAGGMHRNLTFDSQISQRKHTLIRDSAVYSTLYYNKNMGRFSSYWAKIADRCGPSLSEYAPNTPCPRDICGQRSPRSDCANAQSEQGLYCPRTEALDTIECFYGEQWSISWTDIELRELIVNEPVPKVSV